ncbi:MAG: helix-turn-helix domain-containing protein [Clostridia bacterium]|nr:helix-turn-helix domain-containing protein [Clostridia bacterium]
MQDFSVNLIDVLFFTWEKTKWFTWPRTYFAMSYRLSSGYKYSYNGKKVSAKAGDIVIVPSGLAYDCEAPGSEAFVFHFNLYGYVSEEIEVFSPENPEKYRVLFEKAVNIWKEKSPGFKYNATAVFYEIMAQLEADGALAGEVKDKRIADAADYMKRNFADPMLSIEHLARDACMCETLFRRKFRQCCGVSPKKYLNGIRMEYAQQLLKTGYFSHEQISEKCGFSNVKYFRTAFKDFTGKSISEYLRI